MNTLLQTEPRPGACFVLFLLAFLLRAGLFYFYVQQNERYNQADTSSYYVPALSIALGAGMYDLRTRQPIFWRTPGYPWYLSLFHRGHTITSTSLESNRAAHLSALRFQIFLCSFIPLIALAIAWLLTGSLPIAWLTGILTAIHPGLVLASGYLLTDGLATLLFLLFLYFFLRLFGIFASPRSQKYWAGYAIAAAVLFAGYTWIRPLGKFMIIVVLALLALDATTWRERLKKVLLFAGVFYMCIGPWYLRNYRLTGQMEFCPMSGCMLNVFCAPKIRRAMTGQAYKACWEEQNRLGALEVRKEMMHQHQIGSNKVVLQHKVVGRAAWPLIMARPFLFLYDWCVQVIKTLFDLTASQQIVRFVQGSFYYDDLEEFLIEKTALALYKEPMPLPVRILCWLEFILAIFKWIGLLAGCWAYLLRPLWTTGFDTTARKRMAVIWLVCGTLIGATVAMTGAFGYARLRLPVDALMILLSLTWWWPIVGRKTTR